LVVLSKSHTHKFNLSKVRFLHIRLYYFIKSKHFICCNKRKRFYILCMQ